jgi:CBS domain-containing protein
VAAVRSLSGDGADGERRFVRCPRKRRTVEASECTACPRLRGLSFGEHGETVAVTCHSDPDVPLPIRQLRLPQVEVSALMERDVTCVRPELSVDMLSLLLVETGASSIPVVSERGAPLGIVYASDVMLEVLASEKEEKHRALRTVDDLLFACALPIRENASLTQAAALMATEGVNSLLVVSDAGEVVGVLEAAKVLGWLGAADAYAPPPRDP